MKTRQITRMEQFLAWLKTCPFKCVVSSMQGGSIHVKFDIDSKDTVGE
jgi:hypothetical protein